MKLLFIFCVFCIERCSMQKGVSKNLFDHGQTRSKNRPVPFTTRSLYLWVLEAVGLPRNRKRGFWTLCHYREIPTKRTKRESTRSGRCKIRAGRRSSNSSILVLTIRSVQWSKAADGTRTRTYKNEGDE